MSLVIERETRFPQEDGSTIVICGMSEHDACYTNERAGSFNVTVAAPWAEANLPIVPVKLDVMDTLRGLHENIDLDVNRLMQIAERDFGDVLNATVLLYVLMPDGSHMLIDGHHRLTFLAMCCGRASLDWLPAKARMIPYELAQQFKVSYIERMPDGREREISAEELLVRISGIYSSPDGSMRVDPQKRGG